jgi:hypothetical protein
MKHERYPKGYKPLTPFTIEDMHKVDILSIILNKNKSFLKHYSK